MKSVSKTIWYACDGIDDQICKAMGVPSGIYFEDFGPHVTELYIAIIRNSRWKFK